MNSTLPFAIIIGCLAIFATALFFQWKSSREAAYEKEANEFFEKIKPFIEDDETPESMIKLFGTLNRHIDNGMFARVYFYMLLTGKADRNKLTPSSAENIAFLEKRRELIDPFISAAVSAIRAMSYRSIFGHFLLRIIPNEFNHDPKLAVQTVSQIQDYDPPDGICPVHT